MSENKAKHPECGRTARSTGKPCKRYAGQGTNHVGTGACNLHGAGTKTSPGGGQPQNKNALVSGEYETIYISALTAEERHLYVNMTLNPREQAENNLRLICIRIHRILIRIHRLEEADEDGFGTSSISIQQGWNVKGKVDLVTIEKTSTLTSVMALEESITRLQAVKIRAIEQLRAALKDSGQTGEDRLQSLVSAIDRSAENIAAARSED